MPRTKTSVEYNNFTGGFITEASPLTFPENASLDEENININRDGSRQRRFGMDWTDTAVPISSVGSTLASSGVATSSFTWKSAGNDGDKHIGVLQRGDKLYFYNLTNGDPASSLLNSITLLSTEIPDVTKPCEYATVNGKLLVVAGGKQIAVCTAGTSTVTKSSSLTLQIRDRFGIDDGLAVDARPVSLSASHEYNLLNQGWPLEAVCASMQAPTNTNPAVTTDPIAYTNTQMSWYPSNADLIWAAKLSTIQGDDQDAISNLETYSPWELEKLFLGTSPAPRGKYTIDLFDRGASRIAASGVAGLGADSTAGGIESVSAFAGRVWYTLREDSLTAGDDNSPNLGNMVLYSIASTDEDKWYKCHGENDPTEEDFGDVLDSDGGFITIPESGRIYKTVPLGESLFVIASNGVWEIFGGDTGFSASTQSVVKVTDIGALGNRPVVSGDNLVAYWAESGIYAVSIDPSTLRGVVNNVTENTIQSYYDDIPLSLKKQARGGYDPISKQVSWLYNLTAKSSEFYFDKELVIDTNKGAFTKRSIGTLTRASGEGPYVTTHMRLRNLIQGTQRVNVTDTSGTVVTTISGDPVYTSESNAEQQTKSSLMYWIVDNQGTDEDLILGSYSNFNFVDYEKIEDISGNFGVDAEGYIITGALTAGDSSRYKWSPYISVKFKRTESGVIEDDEGTITLIDDSGCLMYAIWEWSNSGLSGRWSRPQQVYRLPRFQLFSGDSTFLFDVVNTRNKVRGKGRALSLRFNTEPGKDMILLGWGMDISMKQTI